MHNRFQRPLKLSVQPSRRVLRMLALVHALAAILVLLALPWTWQILPSLLLLTFAAVASRAELQSAGAIWAGLDLNTHGQWGFHDDDGGWVPARLAGHPVVLGDLVILPLQAGARRYTIALDSTNTHADDLRRLKVRLKHELAGRAAASAAA